MVETEEEEEEGNGFQKKEKRKRRHHVERMKKVFGYGGARKHLLYFELLLLI